MSAAMSKTPTEPRIGRLYLHTKTRRVYRVLDVTVDEATQEFRVVYQIRDGFGPHWDRPHAEFIQKFELVES
jgi:hypothetical protein